MYLTAGSNLFGQWLLDSPISPEFRRVPLRAKANPSQDLHPLKLSHIGWSYNIFQSGNEFYISGSFRGRENQFLKISLPEECDTSKDEYSMIGNDYNLILINRNTFVEWVMSLDTENVVKKVNINVDGPMRTKVEANKRMRLDDQIVKTVITNSSCLHLTANGLVYSGLLPSYLDTSHCAGKVCDIACGYEHFVLLTDLGKVYTWGNGRRLQLGHGDLNNLEKPTEVEALAGLKMVKVSAGGWHSLALSESGDLYAWGWNDTGQLGVKSQPKNQGVLKTEGLKSYHIPTVVDFFEENGQEISLNVKDIACGSRHSAILLEDNSIWVTGCNRYGQLGISSETNRTVDYFKKSFSCSHKVNLTCGLWSTVLIRN